MAYASRNSSYLLGSVGGAIQVVAGWWDVCSHILLGNVDPWWSVAHLTSYLGIGLVIISVWRGLRTSHFRPPPSMTPIQFANTFGLKIAGFGSIIEIIAGVWIEVVHQAFQAESGIGLALALLTLGVLIMGFGMVLGLSIENGMIRHNILIASIEKRWMTIFCLILAFASVWLAAAGSLIYVARALHGNPLEWFVAVPLATMTTLILTPAKRVLPEFGSATSIGIVFNCVGFTLLVGYLGVPLYAPWGLVPMVLFDVLERLTRRTLGSKKAVIVPLTALSIFFYATYYPFTLYLFPSALSPGPLLGATSLASVFGTLLGDRVYSGVASVVLGRAR